MTYPLIKNGSDMYALWHMLYDKLQHTMSNMANVFQASLFGTEAAARGVLLKANIPFAGKHLCWSLFLIKLQAFKPVTLLK